MKQEFIRYVGKEMNSSIMRRISSSDVRAMGVRRSLEVEVVTGYHPGWKSTP